MVRTRLTILILVLLGSVLVVSSALVWTVWRAQYYLERSQISHDELDAYHAVAEAAYRHFKQLADISISGVAANREDLRETEALLKRNLESLRAITKRETTFVDPDKQAEESIELGSVDRLTSTINSILEQQHRIGRSLAIGDNPEARAQLVSLMEDEIDGTLRHAIETAIADESEEVRRADAATRALVDHLVWVAVGVTIFGLVLSGLAVRFFSRRIRAPMTTLMQGVHEFGRGDLAYRTALTGKDEFAQLGNALDEMASRLEAQREELIEARGNLERTVEARTAELERANDRLKRTDAMRQEFLANISHELRTPITVIRGEADVTLRCKETSPLEYRDALGRVVDQARRLGKLVDDLMLIARASADALHLDLQPIPLIDLLEDACGHAEAMANEQAAIRLRIDETDLTVRGDADRLNQLFMILLDNALRYSKASGTVTVTLGQVGDTAVTVAISDDGIGMPPKDVESVFERFYRGETARRLAPQGSGLGLHIARAIVSAHKGAIRLESTLGEGTTVYVTLALAEPATRPAIRVRA